MQREGHKSCSNSETRQKIPRAKNIQKKHPNKVHENKKNRFSCLIVETQIDDDDDKSDLSLDELKLIKGKDRSESQKKGIISSCALQGLRNKLMHKKKITLKEIGKGFHNSEVKKPTMQKKKKHERQRIESKEQRIRE